MRNSYEDILNRPHPTSKRHPRMPIAARAAQFSPFAALTGYEEAMKETARRTDKKRDLDNDIKLSLSHQLQEIQKNLKNHPRVSITFFCPDTKKSGGSYRRVTGCIKKIQAYEKRLTFVDGTIVPLDDILQIDEDSSYNENHSK